MNTTSLLSSSLSPVFEALEPRLAPAGVVTLSMAGGVLTITGDAADNTMVITDSPGTGQWTITGAGTTFRINGVDQIQPVQIPAQASIKGTFGDGADTLSVVSAQGGMIFTGGVTLDMGKGADTVNLGNSSTQNLVIQGTTSIDMGADADDLNLKATIIFGGAVTLKGNTGDDYLLLDTIASHTFQKGLTVDLGTGTDTFEAKNGLFTVQGTLAIKGAGGVGLSQTVYLTPDLGTFDSGVTISLAAGDSTIEIGKNGATTRFGAGLTIGTGAGVDLVSYAGNVTVAGAVAQDLKDGTNSTAFLGGSVFKANSLSIKGGTGADGISLASSKVHVNAALVVNLGAGTNSMTASPSQELTAGTLSYTGTTGNDTVAFAGAQLKVLSAATFAVGAGTTNSVGFNSTVESYFGGNLSVTGTTGDDTIQFGSQSSQVFGNTLVNLGNGANNLVIQSALPDAIALFQGNLTFTGGTGNDSIGVQTDFFQVVKTFQITAGDAVGQNFTMIDSEASIIGSFIFSGGKNTDLVRLGDTSQTTIVMGNTSVNLGAGGGQVEVTEAELRGKLDVTTTSLVNQVEVMNIKESIIFGATTYNLGAGNATFEIDDSNLVGNFTANLGAGTDILRLDATNGSSDPTFFYGIVKINMGTGNDTLTVGTLQANSTNNFLKAVSVDGGTGTDTLNKGNNTFVGGVPTENGFE